MLHIQQLQCTFKLFIILTSSELIYRNPLFKLPGKENVSRAPTPFILMIVKLLYHVARILWVLFAFWIYPKRSLFLGGLSKRHLSMIWLSKRSLSVLVISKLSISVSYDYPKRPLSVFWAISIHWRITKLSVLCETNTTTLNLCLTV